MSFCVHFPCLHLCFYPSKSKRLRPICLNGSSVRLSGGMVQCSGPCLALSTTVLKVHVSVYNSNFLTFWIKKHTGSGCVDTCLHVRFSRHHSVMYTTEPINKHFVNLSLKKRSFATRCTYILCYCMMPGRRDRNDRRQSWQRSLDSAWCRSSRESSVCCSRRTDTRARRRMR